MQERTRGSVFNRVLDATIQVGIAAIVVIVFAQVFFRYVLNRPLHWSEELTKTVYLWLTFIGAAVATRDNTHIQVDYFVQRMPQKLEHLLAGAVKITIAVFCSVAVYQGALYLRTQTGIRSVALDVPLAWTTAGIPFGVLLIGVCSIIALAGHVRGPRGVGR